MLVEHRVDDMDKRFVRREEAVTSGEKVAFQHAFHGVLAEHFHDSAVGREIAAVVVFRKSLLDPELLCHLVESVELIGTGLVGAEYAKIAGVPLHDFSKKETERPGVLGLRVARLVNVGREITKVGQAKSFLKTTSIGVWISTHTVVAGGGQVPKHRSQPAVAFE